MLPTVIMTYGLLLTTGIISILGQLTGMQAQPSCNPSEEFKLTANPQGAHVKVTESSPSMGHRELILRTFI